MDCTAHQAFLSMGFSRQGYWSGLPFPSPGDLPDPEIEPRSPALQSDALPSELVAWGNSCFIMLCWFLLYDEVNQSTHSSISCLKNSMARGAWWASVRGVLKSKAGLSSALLCVSPPSWTSLPSPPTPPAHPARSLQSTMLSSPCYTAGFH